MSPEQAEELIRQLEEEERNPQVLTPPPQNLPAPQSPPGGFLAPVQRAAGEAGSLGWQLAKQYGPQAGLLAAQTVLPGGLQWGAGKALGQMAPSLLRNALMMAAPPVAAGAGEYLNQKVGLSPESNSSIQLAALLGALPGVKNLGQAIYRKAQPQFNDALVPALKANYAQQIPPMLKQALPPVGSEQLYGQLKGSPGYASPNTLQGVMGNYQAALKAAQPPPPVGMFSAPPPFTPPPVPPVPVVGQGALTNFLQTPNAVGTYKALRGAFGRESAGTPGLGSTLARTLDQLAPQDAMTPEQLHMTLKLINRELGPDGTATEPLLRKALGTYKEAIWDDIAQSPLAPQLEGAIEAFKKERSYELVEDLFQDTLNKEGHLVQLDPTLFQNRLRDLYRGNSIMQDAIDPQTYDGWVRKLADMSSEYKVNSRQMGGMAEYSTVATTGASVGGSLGYGAMGPAGMAPGILLGSFAALMGVQGLKRRAMRRVTEAGGDQYAGQLVQNLRDPFSVAAPSLKASLLQGLNPRPLDSQPPVDDGEVEAILNERFPGRAPPPSSVKLGSVEVQELNGGRPTLIPFFDVETQRDLTPDEAIGRAIQLQAKGMKYKSFATNEEASEAARQNSLLLGQENDQGVAPPKTMEEALQRFNAR